MVFLLPRKRLVMCVCSWIEQACPVSIPIRRHRNSCCVERGKDTTKKYPSMSTGKHKRRSGTCEIQPLTHICPSLGSQRWDCVWLHTSWGRTLNPLCPLSPGSTISVPHWIICSLITSFRGEGAEKLYRGQEWDDWFIFSSPPSRVCYIRKSQFWDVTIMGSDSSLEDWSICLTWSVPPCTRRELTWRDQNRSLD